MPTKEDVLEAFYMGWVQRNWEKVRALVTDDFRFSSPEYKRIDLATYQAKCWPNGEGSVKFTFDVFMETQNAAFIVYTWHGAGGSFRCAEHVRFNGEKIREIDCFWGYVPPGK